MNYEVWFLFGFAFLILWLIGLTGELLFLNKIGSKHELMCYNLRDDLNIFKQVRADDTYWKTQYQKLERVLLDDKDYDIVVNGKGKKTIIFTDD